MLFLIHGYLAVPAGWKSRKEQFRLYFYLTMNKFYLKTILVCLLSFVGKSSYAYDCEIGGIFYRIDEREQTASVTFLHYSSEDNKIAYTGVVSIPSSITYNSIVYPVTRIMSDAFRYCNSLTSVNIPNSVTDIGERAFEYCSSLVSVNIPNSVTYIGADAFRYCNSLTSIIIPYSVTYIGTAALYGCNNLTEVILEDGNETLRFPGSGAFYKYSNDNNGTPLRNLYIGRNINCIGGSPFRYLNTLSSVTFGSSVESIPSFEECNSIKTVVSLIQDIYDIHSLTFPKAVYQNATLYIPQGTLDKYKAANGWKEFYNIEDPTNITSPNYIESVSTETKRYTLDGKHIATPQRGINVVKMSDGTVKKVLVK